MSVKDETTDPKVSLEVRELIRKICEKSNREDDPFMMIKSFEVESEKDE